MKDFYECLSELERLHKSDPPEIDFQKGVKDPKTIRTLFEHLTREVEGMLSSSLAEPDGVEKAIHRFLEALKEHNKTTVTKVESGQEGNMNTIDFQKLATMNRAQIYEVIKREALSRRRSDETFEKALERTVRETPQLYSIYRQAPEVEEIIKADEVTQQLEEIQKQSTSEIESLASELRQHQPHLTREQAIVKICQQDRSLVTKYYRERARLLTDSGLL
jgi:hypothetical protein